MAQMMVFSGNANPELARKVVERLHIPLGDATVGRFSDGEILVEINENVRGGDIFVLQSTCAPTNDNLMELVFMIDALRRSSAGRILLSFRISVIRVRTVAYVPLAYRSAPVLLRIC